MIVRVVCYAVIPIHPIIDNLTVRRKIKPEGISNTR